jgi:hypothetical protein
MARQDGSKIDYTPADWFVVPGVLRRSPVAADLGDAGTQENEGLKIPTTPSGKLVGGRI